MTTETENKIRLTQYSHGAGCGCKISPAVLREMLRSDEVFPPDEKLLVGNEHNDDAAVYEMDRGQCLISTTDFFMPVVDDAFDFGRIAATNAISDVYAMGGTPILAVAILGWPVEKLPPSLAQKVLEGARFMCRMAGITLAGGHSIDSPEPIFGLAVSGLVKKEDLLRNNTAQEGDLLFITKPLGLGTITTAAKRGLVQDEDLQTAISYMCMLNKFGEVLGRMKGVHALTDVTGFGLLGHLIEMCDGSGLSAELSFEKIPVLPNLSHYHAQMIYPDMTMKNFQAYSAKCNSLDTPKLFTLCDPQTSGGLLVAVSPSTLDDYLSAARNFGLGGIGDVCIGQMVPHAEKVVRV